MAVGLPPQVRGELVVVERDHGDERLTPAGAGRTRRAGADTPQCPAYPRRCGENRFNHPTGAATKGLPPQVRGEPTTTCGNGRRTRLTPAGAGRTPTYRRRPGMHQAYPRRCGENSPSSTICRSNCGLPPQVRGELPIRQPGGARRGLTPAGAGRTSGMTPMRSMIPAYPRRCGENACPAPPAVPEPGLPPQVRGELGVRSAAAGRPGLTPAGAGRTTGCSPWSATSWAYPRRCGENAESARLLAADGGLPPQVRGEPKHPISAPIWAGLTPAGAGRTSRTRTPRPNHRAYPRRCGENMGRSNRTISTLGLPPQVRGEPGETS